MKLDTVNDTFSCMLIQRLEERLERRVVCVVTTIKPNELEFVFPGGTPDDALKNWLETIRDACQDASKSL